MIIKNNTFLKKILAFANKYLDREWTSPHFSFLMNNSNSNSND